MTRQFVEILAEHAYLGLAKRCTCQAPATSPQQWAMHVRDVLAFENTMDDLELRGIDIRQAVDVLTEGLLVVRNALESDNPNGMVFAAGFLTGSTERAVALLQETTLDE